MRGRGWIWRRLYDKRLRHGPCRAGVCRNPIDRPPKRTRRIASATVPSGSRMRTGVGGGEASWTASRRSAGSAPATGNSAKTTPPLAHRKIIHRAAHVVDHPDREPGKIFHQVDFCGSGRRGPDPQQGSGLAHAPPNIGHNRVEYIVKSEKFTVNYLRNPLS